MKYGVPSGSSVGTSIYVNLGCTKASVARTFPSADSGDELITQTTVYRRLSVGLTLLAPRKRTVYRLRLVVPVCTICRISIVVDRNLLARLHNALNNVRAILRLSQSEQEQTLLPAAEIRSRSLQHAGQTFNREHQYVYGVPLGREIGRPLTEHLKLN